MSPAADAALDTALDQTFPASDPSSSSGTIATVASSAAEDARIATVACFVVVPARDGKTPMDLEDAVGDAQGAASADGLLCLALSPAAALVDWLAAWSGRGGDARQRLALLRCAVPDSCVDVPAANGVHADSPGLLDPDAVAEAPQRDASAIARRVAHPLCPQEDRLLLRASQADAIGLRVDVIDVFVLDRQLTGAPR